MSSIVIAIIAIFLAVNFIAIAIFLFMYFMGERK